MTMRVRSALAATTLAFALTACGGKGDASDTASSRNDTAGAGVPDTSGARGGGAPSRGGVLAGA